MLCSRLGIEAGRICLVSEHLRLSIAAQLFCEHVTRNNAIPLWMSEQTQKRFSFRPRTDVYTTRPNRNCKQRKRVCNFFYRYSLLYRTTRFFVLILFHYSSHHWEALFAWKACPTDAWMLLRLRCTVGHLPCGVSKRQQSNILRDRIETMHSKPCPILQ